MRLAPTVNVPAVTYAGALVAGVLSFASPCVLPLVTAYLSFLGGVTFEDATSSRPEPAVVRRVLMSAAAFVLGFTTIFVILGASATLLGRVLADHFNVFARIAGAIIIVFGIHYTGLVPLRFLNYEARFHPTDRPGSILSAFVMGLAFAFGWTPCVGPVLATILIVAANTGSVWRGVLLLGCYGFGIGVPFLLAAVAVGRFLHLATRFRHHIRWVEVSLGAIMIATGAIILAGSISGVSGWLLRTFPGFSGVG